jgi:uncharacterized glyoxalase superfamily protein PhnB
MEVSKLQHTNNIGDELFLGANPILPVSNAQETAKFYNEILGFEIEIIWTNPPYAVVARDRTIIEFGEGRKNFAGTGVCIIFVSNVDVIYSEFSNKDIEFVVDIADRDYGSRDFRIKDNNGNLLIFSSPLVNQQKLIDGEVTMSSLERAIEIAAKAHTGQIDKSGQPYIFHPIRVMLQVSNPDAQISAILHDVVEDSEFTLEDLRAEGFSDSILEAIEALTKRPEESRMEAAYRAVKNKIAREVKLADNTDNMDISRISNPTEKDFTRLKEYRLVRAILLGERGV